MTLHAKSRGARTVGRVAGSFFFLALAVQLMLMASDLCGTAGWVANGVTGNPAPIVIGGWTVEGFGVTLTKPGLYMTVLTFGLTTVAQLIIGGMCYRSKVDPYTASLGALLALFRYEDSVPLVVENFEKMRDEWEGLAWVALAFPVSIVFDVVTDYQYFESTDLVNFAILLAFTSVVAEQTTYLVSIARTFMEEANEAYGGGPSPAPFGKGA